MKVCKKCKHQLANKVKICKYCGSDVSKAKIIKNTTQSSKKSTVSKNNNVRVNNINSNTIVSSPVSTKNTPKKLEIKKEDNSKSLSKETKGKIEFKCLIKKEKKNVIDNRINLKVILLKILNAFKNVFVFLFEKISLLFSNKKYRHRLEFVLVLLIIFGVGSYYGMDVYKSLTGKDDVVVADDNATKDKVFSMKDVITYKGVSYKVVKVETSSGNSYKSPKEGNQFLIVTLHIRNNTKDKVHYSYANWTMSNSLGEEKQRIFSSINVDTALYSGNLVVGGIKTGSIVFEQPINDSKLVLNYYDLKQDEKDKDKEVIDKANRAFSISIKLPKPKTSEKENTEVSKTSDKKQEK